MSLARPHAPRVPPQVTRFLEGGTPVHVKRPGPTDCSPKEAIAGLQAIKESLHGRPSVESGSELYRRCVNCGAESSHEEPQFGVCDTCKIHGRHELKRRPTA